MRTSFKILHFYPDALDLYGDAANIREIARRIRDAGCECEIIEVAHYDTAPLPDEFDMVYIGHGKARNLAAVAPHFLKHADRITAAVEAGKVFWVTGNSRLLFGKSFENAERQKLSGAGLFDYEGVETGEVFVGDVVCSPVFAPELKCYGFINRTAHMTGENKHPLFKNIAGPGDSAGEGVCEGTLYKNFYGSWQLGPFLLRNPAVLKFILEKIMGEAYKDFDTSLAEKALEFTLAELS